MSTPNKAFMVAVAYKAESQKENWDKNFLTYRGAHHKLRGKKKNLDKALTPRQGYSWDTTPERTVFSRMSINTNIPNPRKISLSPDMPDENGYSRARACVSNGKTRRWKENGPETKFSGRKLSIVQDCKERHAYRDMVTPDSNRKREEDKREDNGSSLNTRVKLDSSKSKNLPSLRKHFR